MSNFIKSADAKKLPENVVLSWQGVGVCYRKPYKFFKKNQSRDFWPFRGLSEELRQGETLGIHGRNGAGKSTLLRLLAGVIHPDEGHILKKQGINVQLLSINLGFERILSGRENALMAGMLLGKTRRHMLSHLKDIEEFSELGAFMDEPVYSYSSGMRARLGFSIAMHADPDVLLLDEVLAVGDQAFKEKSKSVMKELIRGGKSVVLVMHNRGTLNDMSDRVVEM